MDPKLLEILKKSKKVEQVTNAKYGRTGNASGGGGSTLMEQVDGSTLISAEQAAGMGMSNVMTESVPVAERVSVESDNYANLVKNSNLPPEVAKAMLKNPIPQPEMGGVTNITEEDKKQLNPNYGKQVIESYSEDDEFNPRQQKRHTPKPTKTSVSNFSESSGLSEGQIRKMIAEEISRVLPNVVEKYFDNRIIKENTRLMKVLLKESKNRK